MNNTHIIDRSSCREQNIPVISIQTEKFLQSWIATYKPRNIAEIGSAIGYSTTILSQAMNEYTRYGRIDSREISYPHYRQSVLNTQPYTSTTIYLGNMCSIDDTKYMRPSYDFLFIDGRKSETLTYLKKFRHNITHNTTIIVDDVIKFKEKMQDWYQFLDNNNIEYTIHKLDTDDGIITIQVSPHLIQVLSSL